MIHNTAKLTTKFEETWVINEHAEIVWNDPWEYSIKFSSNGQIFSKIANVVESFAPHLYYDSNEVGVGDRRGERIIAWRNEEYRTVTFLEPPTGDLLKWLQKNAVKQ